MPTDNDNILLNSPLTEEEKDFAERWITMLRDNGVEYIDKIIETNYSGDPERLKFFIENGFHKPSDTYHNEVPNTEKALSILTNAIEGPPETRPNVYLYTDSDNDGKHAMAMANVFENAAKFKFFVKKLADTTIAAPDPTVTRTAFHGLNAAQFIEDYEKNPSTQPILIITADNGIASQPDVEKIQQYCASKGVKVDFLITDHHLPDKESATQASDTVTLLDLETNPSHSNLTISGAQTFGCLLSDYLEEKIKTSSDKEKQAIGDSMSILKAIGEKSAVADVIKNVKLSGKAELNLYSSLSNRHNRLRSFDYFLKNIPSDSIYKAEGYEIEKIAKNFLKYLNSDLKTLTTSLYDENNSEIEGGFSAIPHTQPTIIEIETKSQLGLASDNELKILELFDYNLARRIMNFRKAVVNTSREEKDRIIKIKNSENFQMRAILAQGFSSAFANQIFPCTDKEVSLTISKPTESDLIIGSFRSKSICLQDILSPAVVNSLKSKGITQLAIRGHKNAAGFMATTKLPADKAKQIIFQEFSPQIDRLVKQNKTSEKKLVPLLDDYDYDIHQRICKKIGLIGSHGDYEVLVSTPHALRNSVLLHENRYVLVGDVMDGKEDALSGFVKVPLSFHSDDIIIFTGLDDAKKLKNSILLRGTSVFTEVAEKSRLNIAPIAPSKIPRQITDLTNTFGEITSADDFAKNHPLEDVEGYLQQIRDALGNSDIASVSELDVEATGIGRAPALTNIGIAKFFYDKNKKLMVERNAVLVKPPFPSSNAIENLTSIKNSDLRENGIEPQEVSDLFMKIFPPIKGKTHQVRAFNSSYDLNVVLNNLDSKVKESLRWDVRFMDTLRISKAANLGFWTDRKKYVDIIGEDGILVTGAREEDYEAYIDNKLDVIVSAKASPNLPSNDLVNQKLKRSDNKKIVSTQNSRKGDYSVSSVLRTTLAKLINPDNFFHYKLITDFGSLEYVSKNLKKVEKETGVKREEIKTLIKNINKFNANATPNQLRIMDKYNVKYRTGLYVEKHNNNDELSDISLESAIIPIALKLRYPDITQNKINDIYRKAEAESAPISKQIVISEKDQAGEYYSDQMAKLGATMDESLLELEVISSPLKKKEIIYLKANKAVNEKDIALIKKGAALQMLGLAMTTEFHNISTILAGKGFKFKRFSRIKEIFDIDKKIKSHLQKGKTGEAAINKIKAALSLIPSPLFDAPELAELIDITFKPKFASLKDTLPLPINADHRLWKKIDQDQRQMKQQKALSKARIGVVMDDIHNNPDDDELLEMELPPQTASKNNSRT